MLHNGKIAEMKTGEGKTLVSTLPAYLNSLAGKGVHIVTVNDYLAKRTRFGWVKFLIILGFLLVALQMIWKILKEKRITHMTRICN